MNSARTGKKQLSLIVAKRGGVLCFVGGTVTLILSLLRKNLVVT